MALSPAERIASLPGGEGIDAPLKGVSYMHVALATGQQDGKHVEGVSCRATAADTRRDQSLRQAAAQLATRTAVGQECRSTYSVSTLSTSESIY